MIEVLPLIQFIDLGYCATGCVIAELYSVSAWSGTIRRHGIAASFRSHDVELRLACFGGVDLHLHAQSNEHRLGALGLDTSHPLSVISRAEAAGPAPCLVCSYSASGFCGAFFDACHDQTGMKGAGQEFFAVKVGTQIDCPSQAKQSVLVLCGGWAFRYLQLADGSRQILRFLLPGDIISASAVCSGDLTFSVWALTDVQISRFEGTDVRQMCLTDERVVTELFRSLVEGGRAAYELIVALGQLPAERRIAHLLLSLVRRIAARNVVLHQRYLVPLKQRHIGDAVGLTPVHVSRVLALFRDRQILTLADGVLEVTDPAELERLGSLR